MSTRKVVVSIFFAFSRLLYTCATITSNVCQVSSKKFSLNISKCVRMRELFMQETASAAV